MTDAQPALIVVNGIRGSGKTTLAGRVAQDLQLPRIDKDSIKEFLAGEFRVSGAEWSKLVGRIAGDMLFVAVQLMAESGKDLIIENAFHQQFARPKFEQILKTCPVRIMEIYCTAEATVRIDRYIARTNTGTRHPIHMDADHHEELRDDEKLGTYAPLNVGEFVEVDTTHFGDEEYHQLLTHVKDYLGETT